MQMQFGSFYKLLKKSLAKINNNKHLLTLIDMLDFPMVTFFNEQSHSEAKPPT